MSQVYKALRRGAGQDGEPDGTNSPPQAGSEPHNRIADPPDVAGAGRFPSESSSPSFSRQDSPLGQSGRDPERSGLAREDSASGAQSADLEILHYVRLVRERLWLVIGVVVVMIGGAAVYCFTATPVYEATAQLLIEPEQPNVVSFKAVLEEQASKADYFQTQYQILRSRTLARSTLDRLSLWKHPEFKVVPDRGTRVSEVIAALFTKVGLRDEPDIQRPSPDESVVEAQAIGRFLARLTVEPVRNSRLLDVRFRSANPRLSTDVVNTLVHAYLDRVQNIKSGASKEALDWLDTRLAQQRKVVEASELALQRYRVENDALSPSDRQNMVAQRLADLNAAETRAKTERIEQETLYSRLQTIVVPSDTTGSLSNDITSPTIEQLRGELAALQHQETQLAEQLGERHPVLIAHRATIEQIQKSLQLEIERYVQLVHQNVLTAVAKEQSLHEAVEAQKKLALALDKKAIEYGVLQREGTSNQQVFESLLQRAKETAVSSELTTTNIRVVDPATVPIFYISPQKRFVMSAAGFAGIALGLALALLVGHFDDRIKSADQLRQTLALPFLGFVPTLPRKAVKHGHLFLNNGIPAEFGEALRIVRTNVGASWAGSPRVLLVTSAGRGEGKTLIATNLAIALAQTRQRVLLVDGDLRRPQVHRIFDQSREPGFSDLLKDPTSAEAVRESGIAGLQILPAGAKTFNPADLLGFDPVARVVESYGTRFDWIVIDSPPVLEVTDACLFARGDARVVFVVAGDRVRKDAAKAAVDQLVRTDAGFSGAVLSRVEPTRGYYSTY